MKTAGASISQAEIPRQKEGFREAESQLREKPIFQPKSDPFPVDVTGEIETEGFNRSSKLRRAFGAYVQDNFPVFAPIDAGFGGGKDSCVFLSEKAGLVLKINMAISPHGWAAIKGHDETRFSLENTRALKYIASPDRSSFDYCEFVRGFDWTSAYSAQYRITLDKELSLLAGALGVRFPALKGHMSHPWMQGGVNLTLSLQEYVPSCTGRARGAAGAEIVYKGHRLGRFVGSEWQSLSGCLGDLGLWIDAGDAEHFLVQENPGFKLKNSGVTCAPWPAVDLSLPESGGMRIWYVDHVDFDDLSRAGLDLQKRLERQIQHDGSLLPEEFMRLAAPD